MTTTTEPMPHFTPPPPSRAQIEHEAARAAQAGLSYRDACPYPFGTEPAIHFWACHAVASMRLVPDANALTTPPTTPATP